MKTIAITIDVETDWGGRLCVGHDNCQGIKEGIPYLLHLLDELKIKATFFISGEVVLGYADIIHDIVEHGHEIASHGFTHYINYCKLSKEELFDQVNKSKMLIEEEFGIKTIGFRTPYFKINNQLFDILSDLDFKYDSSMRRSIFSTNYSSVSTPSGAFLKGRLVEFPVSTMPYIKLPFGLLWINAIGFSTFRFLSERIEFPNTIVFYLHPFDLIEAKSKKDFGFIINRWYAYKSNKVRYTLESLFKYWKENNKKFLTLREIIHYKNQEI